MNSKTKIIKLHNTKKTFRIKVGNDDIPDGTLRNVEHSFNNFLLRYDLTIENFDPSQKWLVCHVDISEMMDEEDVGHYRWVNGIITGCLISEGIEVI